MQRKKFILIIALFLLVDFVIIGLVVNKLYAKPKKAHFHAGFQVYVDDKLQDFSDDKYMQTAPCATKDADLPEDIQMEKAHLHDNAGDVVHAHVVGGKWKDLFENIRYNLPENKEVKGYVNGKEIKNILQYDIRPYDSVVILVGKNDENTKDYLENAITKEEITIEEKKSENCGTNDE